MAYTKHNWASGEVISSAQMNILENGVEAASLAEYDAVISVYHPNNTSPYQYTIAKGSYSEISNLISNNVCPRTLLRFWDDLTGYRTYTNLFSYYSTWTNQGITYISFNGSMPGIGSGSGNMKDVHVTWTSNNSVNVEVYG